VNGGGEGGGGGRGAKVEAEAQRESDAYEGNKRTGLGLVTAQAALTNFWRRGSKQARIYEDHILLRVCVSGRHLQSGEYADKLLTKRVGIESDDVKKNVSENYILS
jgi:hypothetical protein